MVEQNLKNSFPEAEKYCIKNDSWWVR